MSKYFGKCFGPSTPAPESSFWLRCPSFLLSKFASQLNLIQFVLRVRILGIWVKSSILRLLLSVFWVSEPQFPSPRDLFPGSWVSGSKSPRVSGPRVLGLRVSGSWFKGLRVPGPGSHVLILDYALPVPGCQGPRVPGSRVSESRVPGLRIPGPGSQVLILDYASSQEATIDVKNFFNSSTLV